MKVTARKSTCPSALATAQPAPHKFAAHAAGGQGGGSKWEGVCRACLSAQHPQRLISLFLYWTPPWRQRRSPDDQIAKQLAKLTCVQIEECDGYPQHICHDCFESFKEAYRFYFSVRHRDNFMRSQQLLVDPAADARIDRVYDQHTEKDILTTYSIIHTPNDYEEEHMELEPKEDSHGDSDIPLDCILCQKTFHTILGLKAHVISTHSYQSVTRNHSRTACKDCGRKLASHNHVGSEDSRGRCDGCSREHLDTSRKTKTVLQLRREAELGAQAKRRKVQEVYECSLCKERFEEKIYLKIHTEAYHSVADDESRSNEIRNVAIVESAGTKFEVQLIKSEDQDSQNLLELLGYSAEGADQNLPPDTPDTARNEGSESAQIIYDIGLGQLVEAADVERANGQVTYLHLPKSEEPQIIPHSESQRDHRLDQDENTVELPEIATKESREDNERPTVTSVGGQEVIHISSAVITVDIDDGTQSANDDPDEDRDRSMEVFHSSETVDAVSLSPPSIESFLEKDNREIMNQNGVQSVNSILPSEKDAHEKINEEISSCMDRNPSNDNENLDVPKETERNESGKDDKNIAGSHSVENVLSNVNDIPVGQGDSRSVEIIFSDSENEDDRPPYLEIIFDDDKDEDVDDNPRPPSIHMPNLVDEADEAQSETATKDVEIHGHKVPSNETEEPDSRHQVSERANGSSEDNVLL